MIGMNLIHHHMYHQDMLHKCPHSSVEAVMSKINNHLHLDHHKYHKCYRMLDTLLQNQDIGQLDNIIPQHHQMLHILRTMLVVGSGMYFH